MYNDEGRPIVLLSQRDSLSMPWTTRRELFKPAAGSVIASPQGGMFQGSNGTRDTSRARLMCARCDKTHWSHPNMPWESPYCETCGWALREHRVLVDQPDVSLHPTNSQRCYACAPYDGRDDNYMFRDCPLRVRKPYTG